MILQYLEIALLEDLSPSGQEYFTVAFFSLKKSFMYEESNLSLSIGTPSNGMNEVLR
jgi:hypothetical protein